MFSMTGVNKRRFLEAVKADPQTYRDWAGNAEWDIETTGKEDELFSPFLRKPFKQAVEAGLIPKNLITLAGTWGTVTDQGDLTYLNLVHLTGIDGTSADDLTRGEIEGRQQAMHAIKALARVHARLRGREAAQLRHDDRHPRHAQDRGALRPDRARTSASRRASTTRSASSPSSSTATGSSSCRRPVATSRCRTARSCRRASEPHRRRPLDRRRQGLARLRGT